MTATLTRRPTGSQAAPQPRPQKIAAGGPANVTLAALTLAAVLGISRLFTMPARYFAPVALTAISVHLACWMCRRARFGLGASAVCATLIAGLCIVWGVFGRSTAYGIPWHNTLHAMGASLTAASNAYRTSAAPATVIPGFTFAGAVGAALAAFLGDWAAFRMRATTEACLPSFSLFVLSAALAQGQRVVLAGAVWLAALLAFLLTRQDAVDSPTTAWFASRSRRGPGTVVATGVILIAAAVGAAALIGPSLPGATIHPVFNWRNHTTGDGNRNIGTSPLVDITARLKNLSTAEVFTVQASRAAYWRLTSLDTFNGTGWSLDNIYVQARGHLPAVTDQNSLIEPGPTRPELAQVHITGLSSIWLPAAYRPTDIRGVAVSYSADAGSAITNKATSDGESYSVTSAIPAATPQLLDASPAPDVTDPALGRYLALPGSLNPIVRRLAAQVTAGATTEYGQAKALQDWFRSPLFRYSLDVPADFGSDALVNFLTKTRAGFCQQFAASFAVMARALGLPSRVAVGFTEGDVQSDGLYHVTDAQAHAWPEVYFPSIGWIAFEPTPGRGSPDPNAQAITGAPPAQQSSTGTNGAPATTPTGASTPRTPATVSPVDKANPAGKSSSATARRIHHPLNGWLLALVLLLGGPALWAGALALLRFAIRARRRRRATTPDAGVRLAWTEAREALASAGAPPLPWETPAEYTRRAARVADLPAEAVEALRRLAGAIEVSAYSSPGAQGPDVVAASRAAGRVARALNDHLRLGERGLRLLDPRPTLRMVRAT